MALYIGTLAGQDGVDRVVRAAHHIVYQRGRKDVKFAILGDGDCLEALQRLAGALDVEAFVDFVGWVDDAKLLTYLSTADVCLAPDPPERVNQLSTFIKIMEYMCYGKVTVSFDLLESRRTADQAGIYVNKDDPDLFGDAILEILDAPALREKLGQVAKERVRNSLHWGLSRSVLLESYERVICNELPLECESTPSRNVSTRQCGKVTRVDEI
jgi:glycosyltransferase involved in cell wall biosynthesis